MKSVPATPMKIVPLGNYVLLKMHDLPSTSRGGLALPDAVARQMMPTLRATVVAAGPGLPDRNGNLVGCGAEPGDEILLQINAGVRVEQDEEEFVMTTANMILAVVRPRLEEA